MKTVRALAVLALAAATVALAPAAHATGGALPLPGFGAIAVDQAHHHVFVSGGPSGNSIVVTDFYGDVLKQITGEYGATGLGLSSDGSTLYAALASGDAVSAISTTTLAETARYSTPARTCPTTLAFTGQYLWIGYGCAGQWSGGIGRLDTAATAPAITLGQQGSAVFQGAPLLTAAANGPVVATQPNLSLATTDVYTVSSGALTAGVTGTPDGSDVLDEAVTPDGGTLFTAAGSADHAAGFATADLSGRGAYPTGHYPNALAVSADGGYLAAGAYTAAHQVFVFPMGATTPVRTVGLGSQIAANRGLAFSADNTELFVVTQSVSGGSPYLGVIDHPTTSCTIIC